MWNGTSIWIPERRNLRRIICSLMYTKATSLAGLSYAKLNAPGRFFTEGVSSAVSNFNQLRLLLGYGSPTKAGLGVAANVGLDLRAGDSGLVQYGALQGSYNWDCCASAWK